VNLLVKDQENHVCGQLVNLLALLLIVVDDLPAWLLSNWWLLLVLLGTASLALQVILVFLV
jgi:hypothetical protein